MTNCYGIISANLLSHCKPVPTYLIIVCEAAVVSDFLDALCTQSLIIQVHIVGTQSGYTGAAESPVVVCMSWQIVECGECCAKPPKW